MSSTGTPEPPPSPSPENLPFLLRSFVCLFVSSSFFFLNKWVCIFITEKINVIFKSIKVGFLSKREIRTDPHKKMNTKAFLSYCTKKKKNVFENSLWNPEQLGRVVIPVLCSCSVSSK